MNRKKRVEYQRNAALGTASDDSDAVTLYKKQKFNCPTRPDSRAIVACSRAWSRHHLDVIKRWERDDWKQFSNDLTLRGVRYVLKLESPCGMVWPPPHPTPYPSSHHQLDPSLQDSCRQNSDVFRIRNRRLPD